MEQSPRSFRDYLEDASRRIDEINENATRKTPRTIGIPRRWIPRLLRGDGDVVFEQQKSPLFGLAASQRGFEETPT